MRKSQASIVILGIIAVIGCVIPGCQCSHKHGLSEDGWHEDDREKAKKFLQVKVMKPTDLPDLTTDHITNVPFSLAVSKGLQALTNYNQADAAALGYSFPMSTVYEPYRWTRQLIDGHNYWLAILNFKSGATGNQAAYDQMKGICPGIVVVDAEDESKPAQVRLRDNTGRPYKIKLHFRDVNFDPDYIGRWLRHHYKRSRNWGGGREWYQDDVTPEVEDGNWHLWYSVTENQNLYRVAGGNWHFPMVRKVILVDPETEKTQEFDKPEDVPAWVDRIYSEDAVAQYIEAWGYDVGNYMLYSDKGRLVLDENRLDVVADRSGEHLQYVGVVTSRGSDNSSVGVITVTTRDIKAKFYPTYGQYAMATRFHAEQVINNAVKYKGWWVEDLTLHWLYGAYVWEGSLVMEVKFPEQPGGENLTDWYGVDSGTCYMGCVLLRASADLACSDVIYADSKQEAFDRFEDHVFKQQRTNVGSMALEEYEADGHISFIRSLSDKGQTCFVFELAEYPGRRFRLTLESFFDRDTIDIMAAQVGDHVTFRYGDTKTSPMCNVKRFKDITRPTTWNR